MKRYSVKEIIIKHARQKRSQHTIDKILQSTAQILHAKGFEKTTTADIAIEAELGVASIYDYFSCKEALVIALVDHELKDCLARVLSTVEDSNDSAVTSLEALLKEGVRFAMEHQSLLRILFLSMAEYIPAIDLHYSRASIETIAQQYSFRFPHQLKAIEDEQQLALLMYSLTNIVMGFQFRIAIMQDQSFDEHSIVKQLMSIISPLIIKTV
jgi:AcrR family transcriptional regulator